MKRKILIVDDEPDLVELLRFRLENTPFSLTSASTAPEGLARALEDRPDLILLDLNLPIMSGLGFLRENRRRIETKGIPVVVYSAMEGKHIEQEARDLGACDFIYKWADADTLLKTINQHTL